MNVERLTMLRDALIEYAKNPGNLEFDISDFTNRTELEVRAALRGDNHCGTTACACGIAGVLPQFNRLGFRLTEYGAPVYKNRMYFRAAMVFFGLDYEDVGTLFDTKGYLLKDRADPLAVADNITALLHTA